MTVDELMQHIDDGIRVFVSANGRKREVVNAGRAFVEYNSSTNPRSIECVFTEDFAKWAKEPKAPDPTASPSVAEAAFHLRARKGTWNNWIKRRSCIKSKS